MEIRRIRTTSATVMTLPNGIEVLYSYSTPVAAFFRGDNPRIWRTEQRYSKTTSRQLNEWCCDNGSPVEFVGQETINAVANLAN